MKETPAYREYHPKWHRSRVSTYWWTQRWPYLKFMIRELSSIFVAYFVVITLAQIRALVRGPAAYAEFQEWLRTWPLIGLNTVSLFFVLFHAITWFNLAPRAIVVRVRGKRLPDVLIAGPNYLAWLAVSAVVAWLVVGD